MTSGFIDMALMNSALAALSVGKNRSLSFWHNQSLIEVTYQLLHNHVRVSPGVNDRKITGYYSHVITGFPWLLFSSSQQHVAKQRTKQWSSRNIEIIKNAWQEAQTNPFFFGTTGI